MKMDDVYCGIFGVFA